MLGMLRRFLEIRRVQNGLKAVLAQNGIDFMQLRPDIHANLLQEALRSGNSRTAAYRFVRMAKDVGGLQHLDAREKQWQLVAAMLEGDMPAQAMPVMAGPFGRPASAPAMTAIEPRLSSQLAQAEALVQAR